MITMSICFTNSVIWIKTAPNGQTKKKNRLKIVLKYSSIFFFALNVNYNLSKIQHISWELTAGNNSNSARRLTLAKILIIRSTGDWKKNWSVRVLSLYLSACHLWLRLSRLALNAYILAYSKILLLVTLFVFFVCLSYSSQRVYFTCHW